MKYAIILISGDQKYLQGFTNSPIDEENKYTVPLKELNNLFINLKGDASVYLS